MPDHSHKIITPGSLARPVGFSHGVLAEGGRLLFLAGQTALNKDGAIVARGDVVGQYRQALSNLKAVVEEAGGAMRDIVRMTIYARSIDDYKAHLKELGQVHREFFGAYYPATALVGVASLFDDDALIEVEATAVMGGEEQ